MLLRNRKVLHMLPSLVFISLAASLASSPAPVAHDNFAGWDCHYESLAQSFDERDGRANGQGGAVRVCVAPKAAVKRVGRVISVHRVTK